MAIDRYIEYFGGGDVVVGSMVGASWMPSTRPIEMRSAPSAPSAPAACGLRLFALGFGISMGVSLNSSIEFQWHILRVVKCE